MKSVRAESIESLDLITVALDAQQEAVAHFRKTLTSLASEIEELASGADRFGEGLSYAYEESVALGDECRGFSEPGSFDSFS